MKDLIEYIAKALVDHPEAVKVTQVEGEQSIILELQVAPDDMGKIIGKEGRIANAMRAAGRPACIDSSHPMAWSRDTPTTQGRATSSSKRGTHPRPRALVCSGSWVVGASMGRGF